jgi:hypothetical protein
MRYSRTGWLHGRRFRGLWRVSVFVCQHVSQHDLHGHDVTAGTQDLAPERGAGAIPTFGSKPDLIVIVVTANRRIEGLEGYTVGFLRISMCFFNLPDHAGVHRSYRSFSYALLNAPIMLLRDLIAWHRADVFPQGDNKQEAPLRGNPRGAAAVMHMQL